MDYGMGPGFGFGFGLFHIMFFAIFGLALCSVLLTLVKGIKEWNTNNHSPRLTVPAVVVTKRTNVTRRSGGGVNGHHHHHRTSTSYYVTFEVESGDRMEFQMTGPEYGLLVEGDKGNLNFQGTRYLGFART